MIFFLSDISIASCSSALDTRRSVSTKMLHFLEHRPWCPLQKNNMQTFNYYIWYIHSLYLCICYPCSSALDTRNVGFRILHFLKHRPLVSPAEVQPNSMLNLTLNLWYKEDCKNTIYPFTPFLNP